MVLDSGYLGELGGPGVIPGFGAFYASSEGAAKGQLGQFGLADVGLKW